MLTAIAIPVFTGQLNKSKYGVDEANARSIYAEMAADFLAIGANAQSNKFKLSAASVKGDKSKQTITVTETDGTTNTYTFNGMAAVTFTVGANGEAPTAEVAACDYNDNTAVKFGITGAAAAPADDDTP